MKPFSQLNDAELIELTDEQIDYYVKLHKAEAGIRILSLPEMPAQREIPAPELQMYEVVGHVFSDKEKAEEIASTINKHLASSFTSDYDYWRSGSDFKYAKPFDGTLVSVSIVRLYSQGVYNSIKDIAQSNSKIAEAYKEVKKDYENEQEKAADLVEAIYGAIREARERIRKFHEYKVRIVEYIQLANGNPEVAWNFFDKAYAVETPVKSMIMESDEYKNALLAYVNA